MSFSFNPKQFETENTFKPIPVGEYTVRFIEAEDTKSKKDAPMMKFKLAVIGGKYDKRSLFYYVVDNAFANRTYGNMLSSCGFDLNNVSQVTARMFMDKIGTVYVKHVQYEGKTQASINYFKTPKKAETSEPELPPEKNTAANAVGNEDFEYVDEPAEYTTASEEANAVGNEDFEYVEGISDSDDTFPADTDDDTPPF